MPVFYESLACGKKLSLSEERGQLPTSQTGGTQGDKIFFLKRGKKILEASMQRRTLCAALILYALFPGLALGAGRTKGTNSQGRMTGDRAAKRLALAVRLSLGKPYVWGARGPKQAFSFHALPLNRGAEAAGQGKDLPSETCSSLLPGPLPRAGTAGCTLHGAILCTRQVVAGASLSQGLRQGKNALSQQGVILPDTSADIWLGIEV